MNKEMTKSKVVQCMCVYSYLKQNCIGKDNAISGDMLVAKMKFGYGKYFDFWFNKVRLQDIIKHLRRNDIPNKNVCRRIGSSTNGYWMETSKDNGLEFLRNLATSHIKTAIASGVPIEYFYQTLNKLGQEKIVDNQTRIAMCKYQEEPNNIVHKLSDDLQ